MRIMRGLPFEMKTGFRHYLVDRLDGSSQAWPRRKLLWTINREKSVDFMDWYVIVRTFSARTPCGKSTSFAAIIKAFIAGLLNDLPAGIYAFSGSTLMDFPTLAAQFSQILTI